MQPPVWESAQDAFADPLGGMVSYQTGNYRFADGMTLDGAAAQYTFSPYARWFVAHNLNGRQLLLCDRIRRKYHRLRGWQLCGWEGELPWLQRREGSLPLSLVHVLGRDEPGPVEVKS
ncbi:MAG: hypothetical protein ACTS5I_16675 [Rhodanobacter sp.]